MILSIELTTFHTASYISCFTRYLGHFLIFSLSGDVYNEFDQKVEITEVSHAKQAQCFNSVNNTNKNIILQKTACVDFSFNPLCDRRFKFYDSTLVEAIKLEDPAVWEFFRLLALCHTVMPEEKSEGKLCTLSSCSTRNN